MNESQLSALEGLRETVMELRTATFRTAYALEELSTITVEEHEAKALLAYDHADQHQDDPDYLMYLIIAASARLRDWSNKGLEDADEG